MVTERKECYRRQREHRLNREETDEAQVENVKEEFVITEGSCRWNRGTDLRSDTQHVRDK